MVVVSHEGPERVDPGDGERRLPEPAHPLHLGTKAGLGRRGHQPYRLGRRPLEMGLVVAEVSEEEEEEVSPGEARQERLYWSKEAAMERSYCWAQRTSVVAAAAAEAAAAVTAAAATAAEWSCEFVES